MKSRSFTVNKGSRFVCLPQDGDGPLIAHEGETVLVIVARSYDKAISEALRRLHDVEPE